MHVRLARPSVVYRESFLEALAESHAEGDRLEWSTETLRADFAGFVAALVQQADSGQLGPWLVPQSVFGVVDDDTYVGRLSLRHALTEHLALVGGHIGYDIRSSGRRQGYSTRALALGLDEARKRHLKRVLITFDSANVGSRRVIEANGGVLQDEIEVPGQEGLVCRYWIGL